MTADPSSTQRVRVTAHDPVTGESSTAELPPDSYVLIVGERMEVTSTQRWASGAVQITIKPKRQVPPRDRALLLALLRYTIDRIESAEVAR